MPKVASQVLGFATREARRRPTAESLIAVSRAIGEGLERLGVYEREARRWLPHVTVLRFRSAPRLRPPLPDLGRVSPSEAALYHSVLRPAGAQYEILQSVPLGG